MRFLTFKKRWVLPSLCTLLLITSAWLSVSAQMAITKPGPVSQLTVNELGYVQCDLHADDAAAASHHSLGTTQADLETRSRQTVVKRKKNATGAEIIVSYFNFDPNFPFPEFLEAINAFQSAVDIWSANLSSDVPIFVAAVFSELPEDVLGSSGTTFVVANFPGGERDTWYGSALADKLAGENLVPANFDIISNLSTAFPNWYYGTDGNTPPGDFDFKSVVLHELCHGLNFFGSVSVNNQTGVGRYGFGITNPLFPSIYDRLIYTSDGKSILKGNRYPNFSTALGDALLAGPLTAKGPRTKIATRGAGAKIFTIIDSDIVGEIPGLTDIWLPGSSYSHLDFFTYAGGPNGLMVPFISPGVSQSTPGAIVLGMLDDMGWNGKVNREVMSRIGQTGLLESNQISSSPAIKVFPNPVKGQFTVNLEGSSSPLVRADLIDALGRRHALSFAPGQAGSLIGFDLSELRLEPGLFTLQLGFENEEVSNIKVIKAK